MRGGMAERKLKMVLADPHEPSPVGAERPPKIEVRFLQLLFLGRRYRGQRPHANMAERHRAMIGLEQEWPLGMLRRSANHLSDEQRPRDRESIGR